VAHLTHDLFEKFTGVCDHFKKSFGRSRALAQQHRGASTCDRDLCLVGPLSQLCRLSRRIDSADEPRQVPHFAHMTLKQAPRLAHRHLVIAAIDDVRRTRNAPVLTKLIDTINRHGAPKAQQKNVAVRAADQERDRT